MKVKLKYLHSHGKGGNSDDDSMLGWLSSGEGSVWLVVSADLRKAPLSPPPSRLPPPPPPPAASPDLWFGKSRSPHPPRREGPQVTGSGRAVWGALRSEGEATDKPASHVPEVNFAIADSS